MKKILYLTATAALLTAATVSCKEVPIVKETEVRDVRLNKTELTLIVGETDTLIASVLPEDADNKAVSWESSDNGIVAVDNNGNITAKEVGTALITATTKDGGKTASCSVTVTGEEDPIDPMYPTTIYRLQGGTLSQMRKDFAQRNPNVLSTLNQFGFCIKNGTHWPSGNSGGFTQEEATEAVKEFVNRNPEYTGVNNPNDLQFRDVTQSKGYNDAINWYLYTKNQIINGIEVDDTQFSFFTHNKTLVYCEGNHFPHVYVPENFNYDVERAKSKLLGMDVVHWGWGWSDTAFVTTEDLQQSVTRLLIVPVETTEKIELRVVWQINLIAPLYYIFEIDVMTGGIIRKGATIIYD